MAATIEQFIRDLIRSRVLSENELAAIKADVRAKRLPREAEGLARELVRQGLLTKFQAATIYQGRTDELVLGHYVIVDKIGAGRMGFVYRARRRGLDGMFALKVLPARRMKESTTARQRFHREIQLHVRLSHPNIVRIHDAGEHNGAPYLVMELVNGQDLNSLVRSSPLSVGQTVDYILQVARGLAYAHGEGVVHRDVKPANLLLDASGTVKILDLGLARLEDAEVESGNNRLTAQMQILGTPHFMAPEQAVDPRNADGRADVYSLGCTWFYLLTGRPPYPRDSTIDALMAHREEPVPRLVVVRDDVPAELDAIFQKMLAKRADERFASMAEVVAALEAWQQGASAPPLSPGTRTTVAISTADASTIEGVAPIAIILGPRTLPPATVANSRPTRLPRWPSWMWPRSKRARAAVAAAAIAITLGIVAAILLAT